MLKRRSPEQDFQKSVAQFLALSLQAPTVWSAIGHGGGGRTRGAILKSMGVRKGMPDVLVMHPADAKHTLVLGLELKAPRGKISVEQFDMARAFGSARAHYTVCRTL